MKQRIVLAFDGRPEATGAIAWLGREHDAEVVTLTLDLGGEPAPDGIRDLSLGRGAIRAHVLDAREEFAREIVMPAARAGTSGRGSAAPLAAPLLAKKLLDVARIEKASAVAYVARSGEQGGLEAVIHRLDPGMPVIAVAGEAPAIRSSDRTKKSGAGPSAARVEISFAEGVPTAINGIAMRLPELVESLATIGAEHGIASAGHLFMSAATVLHAALQSLAPSQNGTVRLKISNGGCQVEEGATARA